MHIVHQSRFRRNGTIRTSAIVLIVGLVSVALISWPTWRLVANHRLAQRLEQTRREILSEPYGPDHHRWVLNQRALKTLKAVASGESQMPVITTAHRTTNDGRIIAIEWLAARYSDIDGFEIVTDRGTLHVPLGNEPPDGIGLLFAYGVDTEQDGQVMSGQRAVAKPARVSLLRKGVRVSEEVEIIEIRKVDNSNEEAP